MAVTTTVARAFGASGQIDESSSVGFGEYKVAHVKLTFSGTLVAGEADLTGAFYDQYGINYVDFMIPVFVGTDSVLGPIQVRWDRDNQALEFYSNEAASDPTLLTTESVAPAVIDAIVFGRS